MISFPQNTSSPFRNLCLHSTGKMAASEIFLDQASERGKEKEKTDMMLIYVYNVNADLPLITNSHAALNFGRDSHQITICLFVYFYHQHLWLFSWQDQYVKNK